MAWILDFSKPALSSLKKMDRQMAARILTFLEERVSLLKNPRELGIAMVGEKYKDVWRYRVGDYRILAEIKEDVVTILVVEIGHHREIYR